ncbi:MAG: hypothetical protein AAGD22_10040 [Verrucomicrobiota bacterium]
MKCNGLWLLGVAFGLVGVSFGDGAEGEGLEVYCLMVEPSFEAAEVSSDIPGAERTQLVAGREVDGGMAYYTRAEYEALGVDWLGYVARAREAADRLLGELEPEYERDHRGVVKYAVLRSESHRTAGVVLAPGFRDRFREVLGEELVVLIPDRFTVFVFSKLASDYGEHGEAVVEQYGDATYGVSVEVFAVDDQGLQVIGRFGDE